MQSTICTHLRETWLRVPNEELQASSSSLFNNLTAIIKEKKGAHLWKDTVRPSHTGCWWCIETSSRTGRSRWAETQKTKTETQLQSKHNRFIRELVSTRRFSLTEEAERWEEKHCTCVSSLWQQHLDYCRCNDPLRFAVSLFCMWNQVSRARRTWVHNMIHRRRKHGDYYRTGHRPDITLESLGATPQPQMLAAHRRQWKKKTLALRTNPVWTQALRS